MFICNLHCQLFLRISGNMLRKKTRPDAKFSIVLEGWFGQPKYRTRSKNYSLDYSLNCTPLGPITITNQLIWEHIKSNLISNLVFTTEFEVNRSSEI